MDIEKAVVLAAGKGTRMGSLTHSVPKPMLPIAGKPILAHVLDRLRAAGIRQIALVIGHYGDRIRDFFGHSVTFLEQPEANGTARAALLARDFAAGDPFLLTFGDILSTPADYANLAARLDPATAAVLATRWVDDPFRGAAVYQSEGTVSRVVEKPPPGSSDTHWNSAGVYAFSPAIFDELLHVPLSPRNEYELTTAIQQLIEKHQRVKMHALQGIWLDVGRPEDLAAAEHLLASERNP